MADKMAANRKNTISLEVKVLWLGYHILNYGLWVKRIQILGYDYHESYYFQDVQDG